MYNIYAYIYIYTIYIYIYIYIYDNNNSLSLSLSLSPKEMRGSMMDQLRRSTRPCRPAARRGTATK